MTARLSNRSLAVGIAAAAAVTLCGCGMKKLTAATYGQFSDKLREGGYCSGDGLTSDSEDGVSAIMQTDSGWLAGFYECADDEVAMTEFDYECMQAEIDEFNDGRNYSIAEKSSEEEYLLYIRVDNTCLFMMGAPEDKAEINAFADSMGYSDKAE